jgi:hypothetical protein
MGALRPMYRTRQFLGALRPSVQTQEMAEVRAVLGPQLMTLFESMPRRDQRHCIDVFRAVRSSGCDEPDVLVAALLHDAGKGRFSGAKVRLWHRVAWVLLGAGPSTLRRGTSNRSPGLAALRDHVERGVVLAEAFGAPPEVLRLIREMEDAAPADGRAAMLRAADERA